MKKGIITAIAIASMVGLTQAATIEWDFNDGDGVVDINTISGVIVSDFTLISAGGTAFNGVIHTTGDPDGGNNPKARIGARNDIGQGGAWMSFYVTIPQGITADLTNLAFEQGLDFNGASMTPLLELTINVGGVDQPPIDLSNIGYQDVAGFFSSDENVALTGLTGLTDTTVTFTFNFSQSDRGNAVNVIANTMDDLVLTGTATGTPILVPIINSFNSSSTNVFIGDTVELTWSTILEDTLKLDPGNIDVTGLTSTQLVVSAETTYTLTAINSKGSASDSVQVTLKTVPPNINSFTTSESIVEPGATVTLSWNVDGATSLELEPDIGDVLGLASTQVVVNADITYTLTAGNVNGSTNTSVAIAVLAGETLFTSAFDGNTGAHIFADVTDNVTGSDTVTITDWVTDAAVTSISGLTAIHPDEGGGFAQTKGGAGTYANGDGIYLSRNHNQGVANHGYSLTFTLNSSWELTVLNVLSGHANAEGNDQAYSSDLNFALSGGTLSAPVTGLSTENYAIAPAYHSVYFNLAGTTLGAGTYTLDVYQNNNNSGSYAIYDGITLLARSAIGVPVTDLSIAGPISNGTEMEISWTGEAGRHYDVETNSNLIIESRWGVFRSNELGTGGITTITNSIGPNQTFYRVITK